jgi:hypothetical protein
LLGQKERMRPPDVPSSPAFPLLDPIILDGDMDDPYQESEVDFLNTTGLPDTPTGAGQEFDDLLPRLPAAHPIADSASTSCTSPPDHSGKKPFAGTDPLGQNHLFLADSPAESPENSSPGSSSGSPSNPSRDASTTSTESTTIGTRYQPSEWLNRHALTETEDQFFGLDTDMSLESGFAMDADIETSNRVMDSAFDFDSAASSPSPLKPDMASLPKPHLAFKAPVNGASVPLKKSTRTKVPDSVSSPFGFLYPRLFPDPCIIRYRSPVHHYIPTAPEKSLPVHHRYCHSRDAPRLSTGMDVLPLLYWKRPWAASR